MQLTQPNLKRMVSISAFGAGVLAVAAPTAEASIILAAPNQTVGFSLGSLSSYLIDVAGTHDFIMEIDSSSSSSTYRVQLRSPIGSSFVKFATVGAGRVRAFASGGNWGTGGAGNASSAEVALHTSSGDNLTQFTPSNKYFLFRFADSTSGNALRYGWGELSVSFSKSTPDATLSRYAYDTTGEQIAAGDVGSVPEPSAFSLAGLGALAIGAHGLRRWRAARKAA